MKRRAAAFSGVILCLAAAIAMGTAAPALAHEARHVGELHFVVGFGDEPAYAGQKNSVQLILADADDKPITELGDSLNVEVIFGDQMMELALEPNFEVGEFGTPGDYRAWFFPTRPGAYTFHFFGSIGNQEIDESFTSSPTTFSEVSDPSQVEFPVKDPPVAQVAQRINREVPRLTKAIAAQQTSAKEEADSAKTVAYLGIAVGALGVILGAAALVVSRRREPRGVAVTPSSTNDIGG
jgi:hypothetical protein